MINETTIEKFKPIQGVILYKRHSSDYYLETHDILEDGDKYLWQEGRPFLKESLKELAVELGDKAFQPIEIDGLIPDNVLYFKQGFSDISLAWYQPAGKRNLHFKKELKLADGIYPIPALIFLVKSKELYVVAMKQNTKPTLKTLLFKAPFHNMHIGGDVCLGNVTENKQKAILQEEMLRWEKRFFNSYFSHFLDENVVSKKVNLQVLLKSLKDSKKLFPETALVPSPMKTLDILIKKIAK